MLVYDKEGLTFDSEVNWSTESWSPREPLPAQSLVLQTWHLQQLVPRLVRISTDHAVGHSLKNSLVDAMAPLFFGLLLRHNSQSLGGLLPFWAGQLGLALAACSDDGSMNPQYHQLLLAALKSCPRMKGIEHVVRLMLKYGASSAKHAAWVKQAVEGVHQMSELEYPVDQAMLALAVLAGDSDSYGALGKAIGNCPVASTASHIFLVLFLERPRDTAGVYSILQVSAAACTVSTEQLHPNKAALLTV